MQDRLIRLLHRWPLRMLWLTVLLLGILGTLLDPQVASAAPTNTASPSLPIGHWEGDYKEALRLCLDVLPENRVLITFHDRRFRWPVVVMGRYVVPSPAEPGKLLVTVEEVMTKEIGRCHRYWVREEVRDYQALGVTLHPKSQFLLRLTLSCEHDISQVKLCIKGPERGGDKGAESCQIVQARRRNQCQPDPVRSLDDILPHDKPRADPEPPTKFPDSL